MEDVQKKLKLKWLQYVLIFLFFVNILQFQFWIEPFTDYAHSDEFYSLMKALGVEVYQNTLYVKFLSVFGFFFRDFYKLHFFNTITSNLALSIAFFWYHKKRGVQLGTNLLFTTLLVLSPINIALTRKLHFWAAAFFFVIMGIASDYERRKRTIILTGAFFLMAFFRYEFIFVFVSALMILLSDNIKKNKWFFLTMISIFLVLISIFMIVKFGSGMRELVISSTGLKGAGAQDFFHVLFFWSRQVVLNILYFSYNTLRSFDLTLKLYFPSLIVAFILIAATVDSWKKNWADFIHVYREDFFFYYFPALIALLCVRYTDFYAIMGYVLLISILNFLLNSKKHPAYAIAVFLLIIPAFHLNLPVFFGNNNMIYKLRQNGQVNRKYIDELGNKLLLKSREKPLSLLVDEPEAIKKLFPDVKWELYSYQDGEMVCNNSNENLRFDALFVLRPEPGTSREKYFQSCVVPLLAGYKKIDLLPSYNFYIRSGL